MTMKSRMAVISFFLIGCMFEGSVASAQSLNPISPFQSPMTLQGDGENAGLTVHHDPLGRPCLDIEAASRAEVVNPNVYDHVISVYNRCLTQIKLHVCYYQSEHCIDMTIPGLQRKDSVLGIYPSTQYFRYTYREKF
jgi:hypothetical protein